MQEATLQAIPAIFGYLLIPICVAVAVALVLTHHTSAKNMQKLLDDKADKERMAKFRKKKEQSIADAIIADDVEALEDIAHANRTSRPQSKGSKPGQPAAATRRNAQTQQELPLQERTARAKSDEDLFGDYDLPFPESN